MRLLPLVVALSLLHGPAKAQSEWTEADIAALKSVLYSWIDVDEFGGGTKAPALLRYAFHTCVGGCRGCLNLADPENGGLDDIHAQVNALFEAVMPFGEQRLRMSRADFFALGGVVAVEYAIDRNNAFCQGAPECTMKQPPFNYVYGREDCDTAPNLDEDVFVGLPGGFLDHQGVMDFYASAFGLDTSEATALNGAHTIGSMTRDGSGYTGQWKEGDAHLRFNNQYYAKMVSRTLDWVQFNAEDDPSKPEKWQWKGTSKANGTERSFMLPSDISLVQDLQIPDSGGHSECEFLECDYAPETTNLSEFFSNNQDVWLDVFCIAYDKMTATAARGADGGGRRKLTKPTKSAGKQD